MPWTREVKMFYRATYFEKKKRLKTVSEYMQPINIGCLNIRGAYDKFPDFFRMGTFIDST